MVLRQVQAHRLGYPITSPHGPEILIPVDPGSDAIYPRATDRAAAARYYDVHGYVVLRGAIGEELCDAARTAFAEEVRPYEGFLYRQATADPERHVWTSGNYMLNSLLNIQDLPSRSFPRFRAIGLEILTHPGLIAALEAILGERPKIVQTMYFEGNPKTWAHQDTYYLDSTDLGRMVAAWVAVEDIHPGAGRFFVYPGSHRIEMPRNAGELSIAFRHGHYKDLVLSVIRENGLECRAPALNKGDVLLWGSRTIHGSLETREPQRSRASFTAHYIPASTTLLQFQSRARKLLNVKRVNGIEIHSPKDLDRLDKRSVLFVETRFPKLFKTAKKLAIRALTR
ncbi:MAG TPA: phytanoyl-CoA dioxygenase family protein [Alphaproteobacteria bacterium]|nr:phytanoyl-CoA dioxygenase family protein [Alphaproteobacteria bacterium]